MSQERPPGPEELRKLLDRHAAARRRRDRLPRGSAAWQAADRELHRLEDQILELPIERPPTRR